MAFTLSSDSLATNLGVGQTLNNLYDDYQNGDGLAVVADVASLAASVATYELQVGLAVPNTGLSAASLLQKIENGTVEPTDTLAVSNAVLGGLAALGVILAAPEELAIAVGVATFVGLYSFARL